MSQLEVDKIIPQSGTTLTIGDSGDTITISAGATLSGSLNADNLDSGTVPSARISGAYTGITQTGTLTSFASTGIDDNATSTAITINSSKKVSIGTTVATATLNVLADSTSQGINVLGRSSDNRSRIQLISNDGSTVYSQWDYSGIAVELKAIANVPLTFLTNNTERMRIDTSGKVGIGTSSPTEELTISTKSGSTTVPDAISLGTSYSNTAGTPSKLKVKVYDAGGDNANGLGHSAALMNIVSGIEGHSIGFFTTPSGGSSTERMRIDSSGKVGIGTSSPSQALDVVGSIEVSDGIYIGGTAAANKLDDYEEGTWTPAYLPSGTAFDSISYGTRSGRYVKIGKIVYVEGSMSTSSITKGSASGSISIEGLPFNAEGNKSSFNFAYARNFLGEEPISGLTRGSGSDEINMYYRTTAPSLTQSIQVSDMDTGSGDNEVYFSGTYTTTA